MTWWEATVLGLVEGVTEYLPISSTGHLILVSSLLGLDDPARRASVDAFNIVIQGGAILAVLGLYRARVGQMLRGLFGADTDGRRLLGNLLLAFLPAALLGPVLDDWIETHLFHAVPVLAALFLGGVWMIWLGRRGADGEVSLAIDRLAPRQALAIGLFQCVAMWPGTSRSMMTIVGGTLLGMRPREAAEFSFLLGLPTLGSACAFKLAKNLLHAHQAGRAEPHRAARRRVGSDRLRSGDALGRARRQVAGGIPAATRTCALRLVPDRARRAARDARHDRADPARMTPALSGGHRGKMKTMPFGPQAEGRS